MIVRRKAKPCCREICLLRKARERKAVIGWAKSRIEAALCSGRCLRPE